MFQVVMVMVMVMAMVMRVIVMVVKFDSANVITTPHHHQCHSSPPSPPPPPLPLAPAAAKSLLKDRYLPSYPADVCASHLLRNFKSAVKAAECRRGGAERRGRGQRTVWAGPIPACSSLVVVSCQKLFSPWIMNIACNSNIAIRVCSTATVMHHV